MSHRALPVPLTPEGGSEGADDDFEDRSELSRHLQDLLEDQGRDWMSVDGDKNTVTQLRSEPDCSPS